MKAAKDHSKKFQSKLSASFSVISVQDTMKIYALIHLEHKMTPLSLPKLYGARSWKRAAL